MQSNSGKRAHSHHGVQSLLQKRPALGRKISIGDRCGFFGHKQNPITASTAFLTNRRRPTNRVEPNGRGASGYAVLPSLQADGPKRSEFLAKNSRRQAAYSERRAHSIFTCT